MGDPNAVNPAGATATSQPGGGAAAAPDPAKDASYTLVIDGEERTVTLDEMRKLAEKAGGADKRFREAADERKRTASAIRLEDLANRFQQGALSREEVNEYYSRIGIAEFAQEAEGVTEGETAAEQVRRPIGKDDLSPEIREELDEAHRLRIEAHQRKINDDIEVAVDTDAILGRIAGKDQKRQEELRNLVLGEVQRRVLVSGQPYGPDTVRAAVQRARSIAGLFGKQETAAGKPLPGLGGAAGASPTLHAKEPLKRVPVTDPTYDDYVHAALQQMWEQGEGT